jgi:DNA-binding GntR family transcriptional regulator
MQNLPFNGTAPFDDPADVPSLPRFIYEKLHAAIIDGTLKPGHVLRQEELAASFKTSRVPLREALQQLEANGLVSLRPRRGYAVTSLDERELIGVLQIRMLVEGYMGYVATLERTEEDVRALETRLLVLERTPASLTSNAQRAKYATANREFHETLFAASRNARLTQLASNISSTIQPYILLELSKTHDLAGGLSHHREIFEAFRAGDAAKVAKLSRLHCEATAMRFLEVLHHQNLAKDVTAERIVDLGPAAQIERDTNFASATPARRQNQSKRRPEHAKTDLGKPVNGRGARVTRQSPR